MNNPNRDFIGPFIVEGEGKAGRGIAKKNRDWIRGKDWGRCIYEGLAPDSCEGPLETDHVLIAWSKVKRHDILNLATACRHQNAFKRDLSPEEFLGDMKAIALRSRLMSANIRRGIWTAW